MAALRNGMWVRSAAGVGIYVIENIAVDANGNRRVVAGAYALQPGETMDREPWVHLTNADGSTLAQIPAANAGAIEQAAQSDIPAARVDHLSSEKLSALGYAA